MYVIDDAKVWLHRECRRFYEAEKGVACRGEKAPASSSCTS